MPYKKITIEAKKITLHGVISFLIIIHLSLKMTQNTTQILILNSHIRQIKSESKIYIFILKGSLITFYVNLRVSLFDFKPFFPVVN